MPKQRRGIETRCANELGGQNTAQGLSGTQAHRIWEYARKRAKESGQPFTLTVHDMPPVPKRCPVLGIALMANKVVGLPDSSPSIDLIVPVRGYVPGNVRIISSRANRLRGDASSAELRRVAEDAARLEAADAEAQARAAMQIDDLFGDEAA